MLNIVSIVGRSTMVEQYFKHCCEEVFDALERSTLYSGAPVAEGR